MAAWRSVGLTLGVRATVVMANRHLLVVRAFRAGEVPGAAGRVGGDDGSLVVIVNVAALLTLLAVGDHRTPLVYHYPARNLYCQRVTSVRDTPPCRFDSTASCAGTGVSCSPQAWLVDNLSSGKSENVPEGALLYKLDIRNSVGCAQAFEEFKPRA